MVACVAHEVPEALGGRLPLVLQWLQQQGCCQGGVGGGHGEGGNHATDGDTTQYVGGDGGVCSMLGV